MLFCWLFPAHGKYHTVHPHHGDMFSAAYHTAVVGLRLPAVSVHRHTSSATHRVYGLCHNGVASHQGFHPALASLSPAGEHLYHERTHQHKRCQREYGKPQYLKFQAAACRSGHRPCQSSERETYRGKTAGYNLHYKHYEGCYHPDVPCFHNIRCFMPARGRLCDKVFSLYLYS